MGDFRSLPSPAQALQRAGGVQQLNAPPPPVLGGPQQVGQPGGMNPMMGQPSTYPPGQMTSPPGGQPIPPGMGQPQIPPQGLSQPPTTSSPMGGGQPPQAPGTQDQGDELDQYVNWQAQQVMAQGGNPEHLGFLQTLKGAKDRDPEGFYLLLGSLATGDPEHVANTAMQLRQQRLQGQMATQQQLMGVARERGQQREQRQYRQEDREDRQTHARNMRGDAQVNALRESLRKDGSLERIEKRLGRPIQTVEDMQAVQGISAGLKEEDKDTKAGMDYVKALQRGPQPMAGRIKARFEGDPNFRQVVEDVNSKRDEMDGLKKENLKERTRRAAQVRAAVSRIDPAMKLYITNLQRQLTEAENDEDSAQREADMNSFMAAIDVEDTMGARSLATQLGGRKDDARSRVDSLADQLNDALASIGAPTSGGRKRPLNSSDRYGGRKPVLQQFDADGYEIAVGEDEIAVDDDGNPINENFAPSSTTPPKKKPTYSRVKAKLGQPQAP